MSDSVDLFPIEETSMHLLTLFAMQESQMFLLKVFTYGTAMKVAVFPIWFHALLIKRRVLRVNDSPFYMEELWM